MSYIELFVVVYPYFCLLLINGAIGAVVLPNRICDMSSPRRTLMVVTLVLVGLAGLRSGTYSLPISLFLFAVVLIAVAIHYLKLHKEKHAKLITEQIHNTPSELLKRIK